MAKKKKKTERNNYFLYLFLMQYWLLFIFLFFCGGVGKLTADAALDPAGLVAVAVAHGLALFVGVSVAANISGGHLNPAVTFGLAVGGNITILTGLFYWIAQLLGSIVACALLKFVTNGLVCSFFSPFFIICFLNFIYLFLHKGRYNLNYFFRWQALFLISFFLVIEQFLQLVLAIFITLCNKIFSNLNISNIINKFLMCVEHVNSNRKFIKKTKINYLVKKMKFIGFYEQITIKSNQ